MGGGPQQFGIDAEAVPVVLRTYANARTWTSSDSTCSPAHRTSMPRSSAEAQVRTVELVSGLAEGLPGPLRYLNLGGGFGIPYTRARPTAGPVGRRRQPRTNSWRGRSPNASRVPVP